ncbi:hypothetical protein A1O3_09239 [Capronia epimyces CBS 606.96]|uniref:Uncharacterized protein n=1 Tax=Capronia epimyces CBS 606.96 TaxID=1182542 RepID=W9XCZ4_9EURO|nr:uncharacterized protein A1O3_09239 [Capronia epimyces CBS 606.96]EXJ78078.1 hypothetical protein A1O3_09239 [Capronia epimyces CBS 606.96]
MRIGRGSPAAGTRSMGPPELMFIPSIGVYRGIALARSRIAESESTIVAMAAIMAIHAGQSPAPSHLFRTEKPQHDSSMTDRRLSDSPIAAIVYT